MVREDANAAPETAKAALANTPLRHEQTLNPIFCLLASL
jgi:hypothetical protein